MVNLVTARVTHSSFYRKQISLRVPIDLDFEDSTKKAAIFQSWRYEKNVPLFFVPLHEQINELKKNRFLFRITDMALVHNNKGTFIELILEDFSDEDEVMKRLREIFISLSQN